MIASWLPYRALADAVLLLHFAIVLFVVGGLALVLLGHAARWRWVDNGWVRAAHLLAIAIVVLQAWLGRVCPLTALESWLRAQAGMAGYQRSFVETWVQRILYYDAPPWVFTLAYTAFAVLVVLAWWRFPPRFRSPAADDAPALRGADAAAERARL